MPNPSVTQLRNTLNQKILGLANPVGRRPLKIKAMKAKRRFPLNQGKVSPPPEASPATSPSTFLMQPVIPNIIWDWENPGPGKLSQKQFEFCDHIPISADPDANYSPSGKSFSQNYSSFLEVISPAFEPQPLLQNAKSLVVTPTIPTSEVAGPRGWVLVQTSAGVNRWQPNWIAGSTPNEFLASIKPGGEKMPLNLGSQSVLKKAIADGLNVIGYGDDPDQLKSPTLYSGDIQDIQITADSWGRVSIIPGDWYNSSLMSLAENGPFVSTYTPKSIFGQSGLLPCRISEIIVAAGLKAKVTFGQDFISCYHDHILGAEHLSLLGINLETGKSSLNPKPLHLRTQGNTTVLNISSSETSPAIIGVVIENFGPAENN